VSALIAPLPLRSEFLTADDLSLALADALMRIMRVTGCDDDMLIIHGVEVYPSQVEVVLVGFPGLTPHYQIVLTREGTPTVRL